MFRLAKHRVLNLTGAGINELTRNEIASLILGVLDAEMCRAKYKYKRRKLLLLYIYICYLLGGRSGWEKNCARGLEYGPTPKAEGRTADQIKKHKLTSTPKKIMWACFSDWLFLTREYTDARKEPANNIFFPAVNWFCSRLRPVCLRNFVINLLNRVARRLLTICKKSFQ